MLVSVDGRLVFGSSCSEVGLVEWELMQLDSCTASISAIMAILFMPVSEWLVVEAS